MPIKVLLCTLAMLFISCGCGPMDDAGSRVAREGHHRAEFHPDLPRTIIFRYLVKGYDSDNDEKYFREAVELMKSLPGLPERTFVMVVIFSLDEPDGPDRHQSSFKVASIVNMSGLLSMSLSNAVKLLNSRSVVRPYQWDKDLRVGSWALTEPD